MTPEQIRNIRIKNECAAMMGLRGDVIDWKAVKGTYPLIEEFELTIKIRSIISDKPDFRNEHKVRIVLPATYPNTAPDVRMITKPYVFHPNWYRDGKWCFGTWNVVEGLADHVLRMVKTLQYDEMITNEHSPANSDANEFYLDESNKWLFPCDTTSLPTPSDRSMEVNKKKFVIKDEKEKKFIINK